MESKFEFLKGLQEMGSSKMAANNNDQQMNMKGYNYENNGVIVDDDENDSFVVDLENFSSGGVENHPTNLSTTTTNSRITLQRSLSRKVPQRGTERNKINDRDVLAHSSSPRAAQAINEPEKSLPSPTLPIGSQDSSLNNHLSQHQITIKTGTMNAISEGRWARRSSFKHSTRRWFADPKRVLLFFATLSSVGTMLLIFFTLSMSKQNEKDGALDWQ